MSTRTLVIVGLVVCLLLAGVVSFYASGHPDGLEYVAGQLGFESAAQEHGAAGSPLADYAVRGIHAARFSGGLAGVLGIAVVGLLMMGLLRVLRSGRGSRDEH